MSSNFDFLKNINSNLFDIISEAEKLYRDEYFEQCMVQTRRFAEKMCSVMLKQNNIQLATFDDMISALKDNSQGSQEEKEFIDDLYFLKKNGNTSAHSSTVKKDAIIALECLKRSFELALNFCVYNQNLSTDFLKKEFDINLLITAKKTKSSLTQKYENLKKQENSKQKTEIKQEKVVYKSGFKISLFWKVVLFFIFISVLIILILVIWIILNGKY